jgi:hypothetical protein
MGMAMRLRSFTDAPDSASWWLPSRSATAQMRAEKLGLDGDGWGGGGVSDTTRGV